MVRTDNKPSRDRGDSEERLVQAAADLLGEVGPRAMTVRGVAERAGVNHGLVHHYFGGKDGLMRAAMTRLVEEHASFAKEKSGGDPIPAPLALTEDQRYLRAVVRSVLDDEMQLALTEIDAGVSIPRAALDHAASVRRQAKPDLETKSVVALGMALEMGWAALEPFLFAVVDARTKREQEAIRSKAREFRVSFAQRIARDGL
jgi:AcrR family transcriptional regulator